MDIKELISHVIVLKMPFSEKMKHLLIICKFGVKRIYNSKLNKDFFTISKLKIKTKSINHLLSLYYEIFVLEPYYFSINNKRPVIIDAGANIGIALMYFKSIHPECEILAFEPVYSTYVIAQENILLNDFTNIELINSGISNYNDQTFIHVSENNLGSTLSSRLEDGGFPAKNTWAEKCKIEKLSKYINKNIDFLKLDIEGAESSVIKELDESGKLKNISRIFIEYHHNKSDISINNLSILTNILSENGFNLFINDSITSKHKKNLRSFRFCDKPFALNVFAIKVDLNEIDEIDEIDERTYKKTRVKIPLMIKKNELYWEMIKLSFQSFRFFKAQIFFFLGFIYRSEKMLILFVKYRANNHIKLEKIASSALKQKVYKYAIFILSVLINVNPLRLDLIIHKIDALIKNGERDKALEIYNSIILNPPINFDDYQNALFLRLFDDFEKEIEALKSALNKLPQRKTIEKEIIRVHYRYGCYFKKKTKFLKAIIQFNKVNEEHPDYCNSRYLIADSIAQIGREFESKGEYEKACEKYRESIKEFKKVLVFDRNYRKDEILLNISDVYKYLKDYDKSLKYIVLYEKIHGQSPFLKSKREILLDLMFCTLKTGNN